MFEPERLIELFPQVGHTYDNGKRIVYLDSAATNLKLKSVVDLTDKYYLEECSNIHRGIHTLAEIGTNRYEHTRELLHKFINSQSPEEIIFTHGTTESINLVARSWGEDNLGPGDEVLISYLEHHSNIVPWQMVCEKTGATLKVAPINDAGEIIIDEYEKLLNKKTKLVAINYVSNTLGTISPIAHMIKKAKEVGALFLVDAAQATAHLSVDVQNLDCDFLAMSAHKMFGPTGIGALYGKKDVLNAMPPLFGGGDMIENVSFEKTTYNVLPQKFEAGTPNIAGAIAWAPAIEFINEVGLDKIVAYEHELLEYATAEIGGIKKVSIIGTAKEKGAVISFVIDGIHAHDIATMLNKYNIAVRTGHHCTQPVMKRMGVPATARASFSIYNTKADIDHLKQSILKIIELFT